MILKQHLINAAAISLQDIKLCQGVSMNKVELPTVRLSSQNAVYSAQSVTTDNSAFQKNCAAII